MADDIVGEGLGGHPAGLVSHPDEQFATTPAEHGRPNAPGLPATGDLVIGRETPFVVTRAALDEVRQPPDECEPVDTGLLPSLAEPSVERVLAGFETPCGELHTGQGVVEHHELRARRVRPSDERRHLAHPLTRHRPSLPQNPGRPAGGRRRLGHGSRRRGSASCLRAPLWPAVLPGSVIPVSDDGAFDFDAAAALLRQRFGDDVELVDRQRIRPWALARCHLRGVHAPPTVIVKWLRSNGAQFRVDRRQIATEAAALELAGEVAPGIAPSLIAHDPQRDVLVTEDLAPRRTLHSMLSTGLTAPAGVAGLHTFAASMARLHAATAELRAVGPWDDGARVVLQRDKVGPLLTRLEELVAVSDGVRGDVIAALDEVDRPGPFAAFSNGDSGANNLLVDDNGCDGRLIDFEHACRRHALLDAVALHVPGPVWMTVADPVPLGVENTYREVAGAGLPAVLDDQSYGFGLAAACAVTALSRLHRFDMLDGRQRGHHSRPQLVATSIGRSAP